MIRLDQPGSAGDYGMAEFYATIDTILWGRKTYDFALEHGGDFDSRVKNYLFSRNPPRPLADGVEHVEEPVLVEFGDPAQLHADLHRPRLQ